MRVYVCAHNVFVCLFLGVYVLYVHVCVWVAVEHFYQQQLVVQRGLTPYRGHAHKRYSSIESRPRAR